MQATKENYNQVKLVLKRFGISLLLSEFKEKLHQSHHLLNEFHKKYTEQDGFSNGVIVDTSCGSFTVYASPDSIKIRTHIDEKWYFLNIKMPLVVQIDKILAKKKGRSLEGKGIVYLVSDGENTKIGATTYNPQKRLNELQVGNAKELKLIGYYHAERRVETESMLHDMFKSKNIRGEWFILDNSDISYLLNNRVQASNNSEYQVISSADANTIKKCISASCSWYLENLDKKLNRLKRKMPINLIDIGSFLYSFESSQQKTQ